jgi:hypothetical protein
MNYSIRVSLEIAGEHYSFQVEEPRVGDHIGLDSVHPRVIQALGGDIIDSKPKHYQYMYWCIYGKLENLLAGRALERTMESIVRMFRENGHWDNTREFYARAAITTRLPAVTAPPPTTLSIPEMYRAIRDLNIDQDILFRQEFLSAYPIDKKNDKEIRRRAWQLLKNTIGDEQFRKLETQGYFEVQGKRGAYRFHKGKQGGVTFIDTRKYGDREVAITFNLCIQSASAELPEGDVILSRYLAWKADEEQFLQTANFRSVSTADEYETRRASTFGGMLAPPPHA